MNALIVLGCIALTIWIVNALVEFAKRASDPALRVLGWALLVLGCIGAAALMSVR